MVSLNDLPVKILLRIFSLLDLNDLVSVCRVSKNLKAAAEDGTLYRQVHFKRSHRLDDVVSILRRQCEAIVACKMEGIADSNTILKHVARCLNLRMLKLVECNGERGIKEAIFKKLFEGTDIRILSLKNCELEKFPKLSMKNLTSLSVVDNAGYQHPLTYIEELLPLIARNRVTLTTLRLCLDNVTADEKTRLFDEIEKCRNLRTLQFQYPHVDEIDEKNFRKLFDLSKLVSLSVVVSPKSAETVYTEFIERSWTRNLRRVELGGNICRLLPSILQHCPRLEILRLTCLTGSFMKTTSEELLNMVSSSRHLRDISLKSISASNLKQAILQLPAYLPDLEHVEIEVDGVDEGSAGSATPLKIEFNLLPNFALETQNLEGSTVYVLFRSEELLKFITSG